MKFVSQQRDLYAYLHDQTLRRLNRGDTGIEIAEDFTLPPELENAWHARGYYGSVSHNVKAIYQRYLGWFDGHPTSLWQHPPQALATRYVDVLGGVPAVVDKAQEYAEAGDLRFAAELLKHAVFADQDSSAARQALADVYQRLGYGAENPTWRNFYLVGALELRKGITPPPLDIGGGMTAALTVEQLFDSLAIRVDGPRAAADPLTIVVALHRPRHHDPHRPVQRRADPDREPDVPRRRRPDPHVDQGTAARAPVRRPPGRPRPHRRPRRAQAPAHPAGPGRPRLRHRHAVTTVDH
ncbi:alkyl sulfatase dimerization domain-containing protein [Amycolatopsis carbonis]|uniref:alkyl sulfatase dimerization domain-containing protein n=1 Tax=Amycolatopsis carbonis TaxID=715471 RepID=UPI003DA6E252